MTRLERLQASLEEPLLVSNLVNVRYLAGFDSSNAALVVEPERVRLFSDFRYAELGRSIQGVEFVETKRSLYAALAELLEGGHGFEADDLTYGKWETLSAGGLELVPRRGLVEALRAVKDESELDAVRRAAAVTSEAYARFAEETFVGRTERDLAWRVRELFQEHGSSELSFDTAVASAANGASPHAEVRDVEIGTNTLVTIDAGCRLDGYASDCTRTYATGELPDELARAYEVCLEAQLAGLEAIGPGVSGRDADAGARDVIAAAGWAEQFGHGLGHGIGLEVHEAPAVRAESTDTLEAGNVVSCEPGIYLPGVGGVRIEDMVLVTDDGGEQLTRNGKELVTVS
jgi:Xaa-Pro aminopeptidase